MRRPRPLVSRRKQGRKRLTYAACLLAFVLFVCSYVPAGAVGGDLDPSFGAGGKVTQHPSQVNLIGADYTLPRRALVQPDGKILIGADSSDLSLGLLVRLNADGTLDASFGGGVVKNGFRFGVEALALQPDGKIVAGGNENFLFTLQRFNADGSVDTTFGSGGKAQLGNTSGEASAYGVALQPDGKIVAVGSHGNPTDRLFLMARFNSDGTSDSAFGGAGVVRATPFSGSQRGEGRDVALQAGGKIVVGGLFPDAPAQTGVLARFNADGSPDATFNPAGLNTDGRAAEDLALQSDGKIVLAANVGGAFAVARFNANGSPDAGFDGDGVAAPAFVDSSGNAAAAVVHALALQADGKVVAAGAAAGDFALARFNADGSPDASFGAGGRVLTDIKVTADEADALALQPDGKVVAVGQAGRFSSDTDLAVVRYLASGPALTQVQFGAASYSVAEGCVATAVAVTRTGDASGTTTVEYTTQDNTALQRYDYTLALGRLTFAPGETSKEINVLITDNAFGPNGLGERDRTLALLLGAVTGGGLGRRSTATLLIVNDETASSQANPIDNSQTFVGQHYHDFLDRQADPPGEAFWSNQLAACGGDRPCLQARRVDVSAAFFLSIEFQQTGYFVMLVSKAGLGDQPSNPRYLAFLRDAQEVQRGVVVNQGDWRSQLEANKQAYALAFVRRPEFRARHDGEDAQQYVTHLFANAGATPAQAERDAAVAAFGAGGDTGRAAALRSVIEGGSVFNRLYNESFVLMQYFGYLRRNPDESPDSDFGGYNFWLDKMNSSTRPGEDARDEQTALRRVRRAEMTRAFIESTEYRQRFGFN